MSKKFLLSMGSIVAIAAPVASVISCGSDDKANQKEELIMSVSSYDAVFRVHPETLVNNKVSADTLSEAYDYLSTLDGFDKVLRIRLETITADGKKMVLIYTFQTHPTKAEFVAKANTVTAIDGTSGVTLPAINNIQASVEANKFTKTTYTTDMTVEEAEAIFPTMMVGKTFDSDTLTITDGPTNLDTYAQVKMTLAHQFMIGDTSIQVNIKVINLHDERDSALKTGITINLTPNPAPAATVTP